MLSKLWGWFRCFIGDHEWTCAAKEGIEPTREQLGYDGNGSISGFLDYAKMYCKRCGKVCNY